MIVLNLTPGATTDSTPIGVKTIYNTNRNTIVEGNTIKITQPGLYEIQGTTTVTSTATNVFGAYVDINGTRYGSQGESTAAAVGKTTTVTLYTAVEVRDTAQYGYVTVSFMPIGNATIVDGTVSIKKIN